MRATFAAATLLSVSLLSSCNYKGEETVKEKEFATSNTVQTAIGAAGSTFAGPIMARWISAYQQAHPNTQVNYRAIGSGAGIDELKQGTLQLAASDAPLTDEQIKNMFPVVQIPVAAGPVCAVYNLPTVKTTLRLSSTTLAGIFQGNIISWQDPAIAHDNPGVALPHLAIIVVHRAEGSGTTNIFTSYLAKVSPAWSQSVGQGLTVKWPVGIAAKGSSGALDFVSTNAGTITYAELNYAKEHKLPVASIQNRAGTFVVPNPSSASAAIDAFSAELEKDVRAPVIDPPAVAKEAYPITGVTFFLVPKDGTDAAGRQAMQSFLQYAVNDGQNLAEGLDYARLPKSIQDRSAKLLGEMTANGQPLKSI